RRPAREPASGGAMAPPGGPIAPADGRGDVHHPAGRRRPAPPRAPGAAATPAGAGLMASEDDPGDRERRLDAAIAAYLQALEGGERPDQADWLARHTDLAPELIEFF